MDLSKVDDCSSHDLMVAKLEAYGLAKESLQLISDYLSYHKQRTKIGSPYSGWADVIRGFFKPYSLYWVLYFSIFLLMTFFLSLKSQAFVILQMIILCFPMAATFP